MAGKNLTFKLVMDADNKGLVSTAKNSETVMKAVFDSIKSESDKLKQATESASKEIGNLAPSETKQKVAQLVTELTSASKALETMGKDADLSSDNLKQLGDYGEQALQGLQNDLKQAKLHLNYLSATNATPEDLGNAVREVKELETGVRQVKTAFEAYKSSADAASTSTAEVSKELEKIIPKGTSELADKLSQSLNSATGIIKNAGDNAKSRAGNFTDFGNKAEKALSQLKTDLTQAKQTLQEFAATNASPADIEKAKAQVDQLEKEVQQADQAFNSFQGEVSRANTSLKNTDTAAQTAQKGLNGAKFAVTALVGAMAENGELGAERVVKALQSQASEVEATYSKMPLTIGNALTKISTQWQIIIGEMDQANGSAVSQCESSQ